MRSARAALAILAVATACSARAPATTSAPPVTPTASPSPSPRATPDAGAFDLSLALAHVRHLAVDIGYRPSGSEGDARAASYIAAQLESLGYRVERRPFPLPQGGESWNVVGVPPGFDESSPYLLVGGHYDSINGPGANDNGTGVGVVLDLARALEARPASLPVLVVAFGAEERQPVPERPQPHHVGSRHYVAQMTPAARENLVAMVNVDMVGHGDTILCGRMSDGSREGTDRCLRIARELGFATRLRVTPDWSDNGSFLRAGMNAAWLWTGELPCCYHNPRDTMDVVRPGDVDRSGRLALAILRSYNR
jgi:hypothetical protein